MRSLLGFISPYVRSLEERVEALDAERQALQNRLLHAYSGYELKQTVPSYAEAQAAATTTPGKDTVLGTGIHSTLDLMDELENESLRRAEGIADITVKAARQQSQEEFEKEAAAYEKKLAQARKAAQATDQDMMPV